MIFDTDVIIWVHRGDKAAAKLINDDENRCLSIQSVMELLQGAKNRADQKLIHSFLKDLSFGVLPLTEDIGHRALIYVEEFGLGHGMRAGDAIIAASAVENRLTLVTSNVKHFKAVSELELRPFKPHA